MPVPFKTLSILGKTFTLRVNTKAEDEDNLYGMMDPDKQEISYSEACDVEVVQDTILHECIHAIENSLLLKMSERQVHLLATGLLALFKDNPEFAAWILRPLPPPSGSSQVLTPPQRRSHTLPKS